MAGVLANFGPNSQTILQYGWLLSLLDLPRMVLRTTTDLLDQEEYYGISFLKNRACNFRGY